MECVQCIREQSVDTSRNAYCGGACFKAHWKTHQHPQTPARGCEPRTMSPSDLLGLADLRNRFLRWVRCS